MLTLISAALAIDAVFGQARVADAQGGSPRELLLALGLGSKERLLAALNALVTKSAFPFTKVYFGESQLITNDELGLTGANAVKALGTAIKENVMTTHPR